MFTRLAPVVALASMAALVLAGCTPEEPVETTQRPSASTAAAPDQDELLVEARASWDRYQRLVTQFGAEPETASLELLLDVATPEVAEYLLENFEQAAQRRIHTEGERVTRSFELSDVADAPASVTAVVCVDLSDERVIADEGGDFTPEREPLQLSLVTLVRQESASDYVVASESPHEEAEEARSC